MKKQVSEHLLVVCLFSAVSVWGQAGTNSGVISGEVDDSSGGKVAGAKVEVTSPALIQARETVSGDDGLYRIVNLPPGLYTVTATQTGFSASRRDGIEITTGFTATVNFSLTPGAVTQTLTVTSEAPVLDTQDSVVQKIVSNAVLESLPIGKSAATYPALLPGAIAPAANQDVGGLNGEQSQGFRIHGSASGDYAEMRDGMYWGTMNSGGTNQMSSNNPTATQELQLEVGGYSAEDWNLGGHVNIIPKNGGNTIHGAFQADFSNHSLQSGNVTPAIQALGVPTPASIRSLYEVAGGIGGPIKKDKLWFFLDARHWVSATNQAGANYFFDANEAAPFPNNLYYTQDFSRRAYLSNYYTDVGLRLTWQATKRNQFTENFIQEKNCNCFYQVNLGQTAPEASTNHYYMPNWRDQATWTFPVNNKLVLWAGFTSVMGTINANESGNLPPSITVVDSSANFTYGAPGTGINAGASLGPQDFLNVNENFTASYVSGAHAFKFGYSELQARGARTTQFSNLDGANGFPYGVTLQMKCATITTTSGAVYPTNLLNAAGLPTTPYLIGGKGAALAAPQISAVNGLPCASTPSATQALLPNQLTQFYAPFSYLVREENHAMFAQDQWRIKHLTLNLGLRLDWFQGSEQAQTVPAQPQYGIPAKSFAAQSKVANWIDLNPRLGAAYDLFGNGKTAVKGSISRGVATEGNSGITLLNNPANGIINSTTRPFIDYSGTFNPAVDGANFTSALASGNAPGLTCNATTGANCALGPVTASGFYTQANSASVTYAHNVTHGFDHRPYDWMLTASVEQEITRGVAFTVGYYRTWFGNRMVAQNTAIPASGYDQYCVTPPASTAYPGFGGTPICNLYDPQPGFRGFANYLVQRASNFGHVSDVFTGIDGIVNARFHGLVLQGGVTAGHEVTNYCVQVNSPQDLFWSSNPSPLSSSIIEFPNNNFNTINDAAPCHINPPWYQNLQFKLAGVYTLPLWKIKLSANEQNLPSIPLQGTYSFTSGNVTFVNPVAGHTALVGCSTCKAEVVTPQTLFAFGRNNQFDFRIAKDIFITERWKIEPTFDAYNLFNASPILSIGTAYNTSAPGVAGAWRNVTGLLPGRLLKFGIHLDF
jgi:hypothetical protein